MATSVSFLNQNKLGQADRITVRAQDKIRRAQSLYAEILKDVNSMAQLRVKRRVIAQNDLQGVLWAVVVLGGLVTVGFTALFGHESLRGHIVLAGLLSFVVGGVIYVVVSLNYPFMGEICIRPDGYEYLIEEAGWQGKFVLRIIVGWADGNIVCPRGLATAWAKKHAHPTFVDSKHNYLENKLALGRMGQKLTRCISPGMGFLLRTKLFSQYEIGYAIITQSINPIPLLPNV